MKQIGQVVRFLVFASLIACPAFAIVIPSFNSGAPGQDFIAADYLAPYNSIINGVNLNGVVLVNFSGVGCSGALISANQILTAAHCTNNLAGTVSFVNSGNTFDVVSVASFTVDPLYNGDATAGGDLAILQLASNAPSYATIYSLYSGVYNFGSAVALTGFGTTGTGDTGAITYDQLRRRGQNVYDTTGVALGWSSSLWLGDFDTGYAANNVIGGTDTAIANEVDIAHGDSGGPSFYKGQIIGVHDLIACSLDPNSGNCAVPPAVNSANNSYYGQLFADANVSSGSNLLFVRSLTAPEPSTFLLFGAGLPILLWIRRKCKSVS